MEWYMLLLHIIVFISEVMALTSSILLLINRYYVWATLNATLFVVLLIPWIWSHHISYICKKSRERLAFSNATRLHVSQNDDPSVRLNRSMGLPHQDTSIISFSEQPPSYTEVIIDNPNQAHTVMFTSYNDDMPPKYEDCFKEMPHYLKPTHL